MLTSDLIIPVCEEPHSCLLPAINGSKQSPGVAGTKVGGGETTPVGNISGQTAQDGLEEPQREEGQGLPEPDDLPDGVPHRVEPLHRVPHGEDHLGLGVQSGQVLPAECCILIDPDSSKYCALIG